MPVNGVYEAAVNLLKATDLYVRELPVLSVAVGYVKESYKNDPYRVIVEAILILWALYYVLKKDNQKDNVVEKLTSDEIEGLIHDWQPEPLVPHDRKFDQVVADYQYPSTLPSGSSAIYPEIKGKVGLQVRTSDGSTLAAWSTANFLGIQNNPEVVQVGIDTVRKYGVGACGPSGFYGTIDVHLSLEEQIAKALKVEEAIIYAQGFMAVASVIPAFSKRGDVLVADDQVSFAIQTGLEISRSHVYYFAHNDMNDLLRVLNQVNKDYKGLPLTRRFIVTEGLFAKTGDFCNLPKLMEIKKKHKYRLIVDESLSFGVLGAHGLGVTEHFGVDAKDVDIIAGSFSNALGSSGGFCAGSHAVVDHQRLSSQAYCFSAALPAYLTKAASYTIKRMMEEPELLKRIATNITAFDLYMSVLKTKDPVRFEIVGDRDSPLRFLRMANNPGDVKYQSTVMNRIIALMRNRKYLLARAQYVHTRERNVPPPCIKICISGGFTREETEEFAKALFSVLSMPSILESANIRK